MKKTIQLFFTVLVALLATLGRANSQSIAAQYTSAPVNSTVPYITDANESGYQDVTVSFNDPFSLSLGTPNNDASVTFNFIGTADTVGGSGEVIEMTAYQPLNVFQGGVAISVDSPFGDNSPPAPNISDVFSSHSGTESLTLNLYVPGYGPTASPTDRLTALSLPIVIDYSPEAVYTDLSDDGPRLAGNWTITTTATYTVNYTPFTTAQYITNVLATLPAGADPVDVSRSASQTIIDLRNSSAATSSQNTNLRDAEYALEGYTGGAIVAAGASIADILNPLNSVATLGPIGGLEVYNLGKYLGYAWASTQGLPATAPGGIDPNLVGYDLGMRGVPLSELPASLAAMASLPPASTTPLQAMAPLIVQTYSSVNDAVGNAITNITNALFAFTVSNPSTSAWIDPASASSLSCAVLGNERIQQLSTLT